MSRPPGPGGATFPKTPTPTPTIPTTPGGQATTGFSMGPDLTQWQLWWEFNKDPFLLLKEAVHAGGVITGSAQWYMGASRRRGEPMGLAPTSEQKKALILPALKRALVDTNNPDLVTACLVALGKVGMDHREFQLLPLISRYLSNKQQDVRETAALALGITQMPAALPVLRDLLADNAAGRQRVRRSEVDDRTRAFAAYGLGILASAAGASVKTSVYEALGDVLDDRKLSRRDVKVAAVNALGVLNLDTADAGQKRLMWRTLQTLWAYYQQDLGKGEQFIQAHVPVAIGRLLGRGTSTEHVRYKKAFATELSRTRRRNNVIYQSAAIALGRLVDSGHEEDKVYSKALLDYYHRGRDQQSRYFALMAMATIGGDENRTALLKALARGNKQVEKPWAALALGVLTHEARKLDPNLEDHTVGDAILEELLRSRNKSSRGAYAVALGLCGYRDAASDMRALVDKNRNHDELAGYLSIGLALMDDRKAIPLLRDLVEDSVRRPELLRQAAIALGKLRDKDATDLLLRLIADNDPNTARLAAVATGLGYIGDRRTVGPLLRYLFDDDMTKLSRAFVAAALGSIADKEPLPFNSR
ncbi:MAG: HEAT repeat domain-containing protein, partial [Planctomycetota bacterium]